MHIQQPVKAYLQLLVLRCSAFGRSDEVCPYPNTWDVRYGDSSRAGGVANTTRSDYVHLRRHDAHGLTPQS